MPARDIFHDTVKRALIKEDWVITHDPYWIKLVDSDINIYVDLAAERLIAAEKGLQKIAVEIKGFPGPSFIADFHEALGQYLDYRVALREKEPERKLYLAVPIDIYNAFFRRRFIQSVCQEYHVILIIFDPETEEILSWKN
jgi:hypothetical protein